MFGWLKDIFRWFAKKNTRVVSCIVIGLNGAGKSSLLASLVGEAPGQTTPTVGFASEVIQRGKYQLKLFDLGGGASFRNIWERYYAEAHGAIFVIDAADIQKLDAASEVFLHAIQDPSLSGKPVLVCANKHDLAGALSEEEVKNRINLDQHTQCTFSFISTNACQRPLDPKFSNGIDWLLEQIDSTYGLLEERVTKDVEAQRTSDKRIKEERAKRETEESEQKAKRKRDSQMRITEVMKAREQASSDPSSSHPLPIYELEQNQALDESLANSLLPNAVSSPGTPTLSPTSPLASSTSSNTSKASSEHYKPSSEHYKPSSEHYKPSSEHYKPSSEHYKPSSEHYKASSEHYKPSNNLILSDQSPYSTFSPKPELSRSDKKNRRSTEELPLGMLVQPKRKSDTETGRKDKSEEDDGITRRQSDLPEPHELMEVSQKQLFLSTDWPMRKEVLPSIHAAPSTNSSVNLSSSSNTPLHKIKLIPPLHQHSSPPSLSPVPSRSPPSSSSHLSTSPPSAAWEKMDEIDRAK